MTPAEIQALKDEQASLIAQTSDQDCIAYAKGNWDLCQRLEYVNDMLNGNI